MQNIALLVRAAQVSLVLFSLAAASFGQIALKKAGPVKKAAWVKAGSAAPSGAFNWFVTKTADTNDGVCDTDCSLREALAVSANGDWIFFSPLFDTPQTITLTSGLTVASKNLVITGPGADRLTIAGTSPTDSVFQFTTSASTLTGVTITGGNSNAHGLGGGILAANAPLALDGVHVAANFAAAGGGGILFNGANGFSIQNSTISGNSSDTGGGLYIYNSHGTMTNSTISGNTATSLGGGLILESGSSLNLIASTVYSNSSTVSVGGGMFLYAGTSVNSASTIIAGNSAASHMEIYSLGSVTSAGFNLVGSSPAGASDTINPIAYQGSDILGTDPQLNALSGGLGTTPTHLPKASPVSPVIDKGNSFGEPWDQRGQNRIYDNPSIANAPGGDGADIGSSERGAPTAAPIIIGGRITTADGRGVKGARVSIQFMSTGETRNIVTGSFGYYSFDNLQVGQAYLVSVSAKRFVFSPSSRMVSHGDSAMDENFVAVQ